MKTFFRNCLVLYIATLSVSQPAQAEVVSMVEASAGITLASISGIRQRSDMYPMGFDLRWLSFQNRILAYTGEFNYSKSPQYNRAALQLTRVGVQYYPLALGASFEDSYETMLMRYDAFAKPYLSASFGFGRFLVEPVDSVAAAELSSDFLFIGGGMGSALQFSRSFAMDVGLDAGLAMGSSAIAFTGLIIRPRVGFLVSL